MIKKKESTSVLKKALLASEKKRKNLEKIIIDRDKFISLAAHQLNTPLTGMKWVLNLLTSDKPQKFSVKQVELLNRLIISNDRMIDLVRALLDVSHIERGYKFDIIKTKVNINKLIKQVVKENKNLAKENKVIIEKDFNCSDKLELKVDADKIKQVFYILINNAIKYSKAKARVKITCLINKDKITFSIKDNGKGIPQKQQKQVFQKFLRGDNLEPIESEGTGLSLFIAKAIIKAHGGKIWFESLENKGATFYFSLKNK